MPPLPVKTPPPNQLSEIHRALKENPIQKAPGFKSIAKAVGHRIVLYGTGGIGKTTLATTAPRPIRFVDSDDSLPRLAPKLQDVNDILVADCNDWASLRLLTRNQAAFAGIKTFILDSITQIESWAIEYTIKTVPNEKGKHVNSIEGYGYGKGYQHVFETFCLLLGDLDRLCRQGMNVILIAHECKDTVPNPEGEDWVRYEPKLQTLASGKSSIRLRVKEWADHVLFLGYDLVVEDGVGKGQGSRTLYTTERPHCIAKSRTATEEVIPLAPDVDVWASILK